MSIANTSQLSPRNAVDLATEADGSRAYGVVATVRMIDMSSKAGCCPAALRDIARGDHQAGSPAQDAERNDGQ
jgi:hypothetical protein